jgi:hypothetical protein
MAISAFVVHIEPIAIADIRCSDASLKSYRQRMALFIGFHNPSMHSLRRLQQRSHDAGFVDPRKSYLAKWTNGSFFRAVWESLSEARIKS